MFARANDTTDRISLREQTLREITIMQHEKTAMALAKELLTRIRTAVRLSPSGTPISASVSSNEPDGVTIRDWADQRKPVEDLLQTEEHPIKVHYEHCWWSLGLCCRPRHRLVATLDPLSA
jgi:hypothetical protein